MKSVFVLWLALLLSSSTFAQASAQPPTAIAQHWTAVYQLTPAQQHKANKIEQRREKQLAEIAAFKATNPTLYRQKREAIYKGNRQALKMMLSPQQREVFKQQERDLRVKRAKKMSELKGKATPEEMQDALLDLTATY